MSYTLTRKQLLLDLYQAYGDASKHKHHKHYLQRFQQDLDAHLAELCDELYERRYIAKPSKCFVINFPKKREVFAAHFRDRIVHHLYFNYVHQMFERTFIQDAYSCIKQRGTHFGIRRLTKHIRQESHNYRRTCYVLKMDIRGYFMSINRIKLLELCSATLDKMALHKVSKYRAERWCDRVDMSFVKYLTQEIVLLNPVSNCCIVGSESDWEGLPNDKSLFHSLDDCGLPIGNLTSQLFSNVYLNVFDQWMKRTMGIKHYGRYVDDFYVVDSNCERLQSIIPLVREFLKNKLNLTLHEGKLKIVSVKQGVEFLGAFIKPFRQYVSKATLCNMKRKLTQLQQQTTTLFHCMMKCRSERRVLNERFLSHVKASLCSYGGVLSHGNNYHLRHFLFSRIFDFSLLGHWHYNYAKFVSD
ncbi:MAG: RNA-directed DNA polymerase [Bacteroidales bacterium]|nr:RNA-directed DNA polymerase [Bacteroidales bacterium]